MGPAGALLSLVLVSSTLSPGGGFIIHPCTKGPPMLRARASERTGQRLGVSLNMCTSPQGPDGSLPAGRSAAKDWRERMADRYHKESNQLRSVDESLGVQILSPTDRICVPGARGIVAEGGPDFVATGPAPELAHYDDADSHMCRVAFCAKEQPSLHARLLQDHVLPDPRRMRLLLRLLDSQIAESIVQVAPWGLQRAYIETKGRLASLLSMPMYPEGVAEGANPLLKACVCRIMLPEECDQVIADAEEYAAREGWTTSRHEDSPTTDVPIRNLPKASRLWEETISPRIRLAMAQNFGFKAFFDIFGACCSEGDIQPVDVFVVKYRHDQQRELSVHRDGAIMTFSLLLNDAGDFEGGGTYFEESGRVYRPQKGVAVLHSGKRRHGGYPISAGTRYILVGFCWVTSPLLTKEMRTWQVGLPGWYVNSRASSDAEILNRVFTRSSAKTTASVGNFEASTGTSKL